MAEEKATVSAMGPDLASIPTTTTPKDSPLLPATRNVTFETPLPDKSQSTSSSPRAYGDHNHEHQNEHQAYVNENTASSEMIKNDTIRIPNGYLAHSPATNSTSTSTSGNSIPGPSSSTWSSTTTTASSTPSARNPLTATVPAPSRFRNPVPPSPLSRIQSPSTSPEGDMSLPPSSLSHPPQTAYHLPPSNVQRAYQKSPEASCFIHSQLDKRGSGSLQDWIRQKGGDTSRMSGPSSQSTWMSSSYSPSMPQSQSVPMPRGGTNGPHRVFGPQSRMLPPTKQSASSSTAKSAPPSSVTSPLLRETSMSGYESDKSSVTGGRGLEGSAILDGDLMDDDEEGRSLTRQLAETAQGVREMSKELGRTLVRSRIQHVLIVTKARDNRLIRLTRELAVYLMDKRPTDASAGGSQTPSQTPRPGDVRRGMVVYVDAQLRGSRRFDAAGIQRDYPHFFEPVGVRRRSSSSASVNNVSAYSSTTSMVDMARRTRDEGQLRYWTAEMCSNMPQLFDFVITLGGDGTVLFTSWLFQKIVPPVLPFALGSLGFLTNFDFAQYKQTVDRVVDEGIRVNLRMRFTCTVYRAIAPEELFRRAEHGKRKAIKRPGGEILINQVDKGGWEALEGGRGMNAAGGVCATGTGRCGKKDREILCFSTRPVEQFEVLNDLVVDRGPSPFVSLLEVFGDEHHLTTVQADGLTVSTPTGSTAYSLSAGGSLVHPQIPALLLTPICPHTLSFRPMLLPDSMELRVCVPYNSRSTAWASFDGRGRVELKQGDHIKITASKYPFPTVCADKQSTDWFQSISRTLRWNEREKQKSFVVVEEDHEPAMKKPNAVNNISGSGPGAGSGGIASGQVGNPGQSLSIPGSGGGNQIDGKGSKQPTVHEHEGEDDECDEDEDEDDEEDEEEEFDIDDKSGGELTPSSPSMERLPQPKSFLSLVESHKSGVDSPDRFVTPYDAPPPLSQRHLVEALASARLVDSDLSPNRHGNCTAPEPLLRVHHAGNGSGSGHGHHVHQHHQHAHHTHSHIHHAHQRDEIPRSISRATSTSGDDSVIQMHPVGSLPIFTSSGPGTEPAAAAGSDRVDDAGGERAGRRGGESPNAVYMGEGLKHAGHPHHPHGSDAIQHHHIDGYHGSGSPRLGAGHTRTSSKSKSGEVKAKAFAFFGDDSGSDQSESPSE